MGIYAATNTDPIPDRFRWFVSAGCNASWDDPEVRTTVTVTVTDRMAWHKKKTTNDWWNDRHRMENMDFNMILYLVEASLMVVVSFFSSTDSFKFKQSYIAIAKSMAFFQISELKRHLPSRAPQDWRQTVCWRSRGRWAEASSTCWRIYPGNSPRTIAQSYYNNGVYEQTNVTEGPTC